MQWIFYFCGKIKILQRSPIRVADELYVIKTRDSHMIASLTFDHVGLGTCVSDIISYRIVSHRIVSYRIMSYHIIYHIISRQCSRLGQFVMPETCGNWLGLVNTCAYYAHQTRGIYQVLPYSAGFKAPRELWNLLSKTVLSKCSLFGIKDLLTFEMAVKLKRNEYVGPVNIFPKFWHPYHTIPYHTISYHIISSISYHIIAYHHIIAYMTKP